MTDNQNMGINGDILLVYTLSGFLFYLYALSPSFAIQGLNSVSLFVYASVSLKSDFFLSHHLYPKLSYISFEYIHPHPHT